MMPLTLHSPHIIVPLISNQSHGAGFLPVSLVCEILTQPDIWKMPILWHLVMSSFTVQVSRQQIFLRIETELSVSV